MTTGYLLAGLPGSGKSAVADILSAKTGGGILEAGEMIREMARQEGLEDPASHELANFAGNKREEEGPGFFAERAVGMINRGEYDPEYPLVVDSVRHINGAREFRKHFTTSFLVWIEADVETRHDRLRDRGRDDEAEFTIVDMMRRDEIELEDLGQRTLINSDEIDYEIENMGTMEDLRDSIQDILA